MNSAIGRAIECIWTRSGEPLAIDDMANSALLSKYHFCRTFFRVTGVSPGRFLSAVRIYQAKRLLLSTSMNVTDISYTVGFNSLGSFTNHFTESVGISPGRFRRMARADELELLGPSPKPLPYGETVGGTVVLPDGHAIANIYIGVFRTAILQGRPQAATMLQITSPDQWEAFEMRVPPGEWFVHAVAVADTIDPEPWNRRVLLVARTGLVSPGQDTRADVLLTLRPASPFDPPTLFALPELDSRLDQISLRYGLSRELDASVPSSADSSPGLVE